MKIICPQHNGPIEIPDRYIAAALENPKQAAILNCPICNKQLLIHHVQKREEGITSNDIK